MNNIFIKHYNGDLDSLRNIALSSGVKEYKITETLSIMQFDEYNVLITNHGIYTVNIDFFCYGYDALVGMKIKQFHHERFPFRSNLTPMSVVQYNVLRNYIYEPDYNADMKCDYVCKYADYDDNALYVSLVRWSGAERNYIEFYNIDKDKKNFSDVCILNYGDFLKMVKLYRKANASNQ